MDIFIRNATKEDLKELVSLSVELAEYNSHNSNERSKFFMENWQHHFQEETLEFLQKRDSISLVALLNNKIVGLIYAFYSADTSYCYIEELIVSQGHRGNKVGEKLLIAAEEFCKKYDVPIKIEVYSWNKSAISFYSKHGYIDEGVVLEKTL